MTDAQDKVADGAVLSWWRALHPDESGKGGDRGAAARLRRCATPTEALLVREAVMLHGALRAAHGKNLTEAQSIAIGTLAVILATVKPAGKRSFLPLPASLGRTRDGLRPKDGEGAVMSRLRFGALMRATDAEERHRHLRRAVDLPGTPFDVVRFADDLLHWNDARKRRWIFDYYQEGENAPDESKIEGETVR